MNDFLSLPRDSLLTYIAKQADTFFPIVTQDTKGQLEIVLDEAIERMSFCVDRVRMWRDTGFHPLHSEKYTVFLYYLANSLFNRKGDRSLCEKLFYLNKALNGFHCFYDVELPDIFFVGHSVGIVLVRAKYPRYFAVYQGATVGKNNGFAPVLEEGLVMYPGSSIIGQCRVRSGTVVSANTFVDRDTPGSCIVFRDGRDLVFKKTERDIVSEFFFF